MSEPTDVLQPAVVVPAERSAAVSTSGPTVSPSAPKHSGAAQAPAGQRPVYALGRIEPRFPTQGVEKEFAQVLGRADSAGLTDRAAVHEFLGRRENRYLAREVCWVFSVEGLETYILRPRDPVDFELLIESLRPGQRLTTADFDIVIGVLGAIARPDLCNGLMVPIVHFDQIYSFDTDSLIRSIPRPEGVAADQYEDAALDLFLHIVQLADNAGATDEHRALNYLSVRYPDIYHRSAERLSDNATLSGVEVAPSRLSVTRQVVDVIFSYTNRQTDVVDKYFVRVDVTEKYPFLVTKLSPYFNR